MVLLVIAASHKKSPNCSPEYPTHQLSPEANVNTIDRPANTYFVELASIYIYRKHINTVYFYDYVMLCCVMLCYVMYAM